MEDTSMEIMVQYLRRCIVITFTMADVFIRILAQHLRHRWLTNNLLDCINDSIVIRFR